MKRSASTLAVLLACSPLAHAAPILHWQLDESSGTVTADSSGNATDGIWQGTGASPGWQPAGGIDGGSLLFSGADADSFITDTFSTVTTTPLTISTWIKTTSTNKVGVSYLGNGERGDQYFVLGAQGGLARSTGRNTSEQIASGNSAINDGEWHHLLAVFVSPTERTLYVDGVLEASGTVEVPEFSLNRFGIGALTRNTPYAPADLYAGEIDDVALWDRALAAVDAAALSGLGVLGSGNAADSDLLVDAFNSQSSVFIRDKEWEYATGLEGTIGATGGSVLSRTAFIVLDDLGNGMQMVQLAGNPVLKEYSATPPVIFLGESATLTWNVENATGVTIDQGVGAVANPSGSEVVSPTVTTTYTLSATNGNGTTLGEAKVTVIAEPIIDGFTIDHPIIFNGEAIELSWTARNFTTLEIDNGVGVVTGETGSVTVNPSEDTTYTLTATNATTSATADIMVMVYPTPPPRELLLHWPLDEGSGTTTADLAGTNPGIFLETGGSPTWTEGLIGGGALTFPNTDGVSVRAFGQLVDKYPFAVAGWVKTFGSGNDTFAVLGSGVFDHYYSLRVNSGRSQLTTRNANFFDLGGPTVNDDLWHFVVGVFAHPASASLYVDGQLINERTTDSGEFFLPDRFAIGALDRTDTSVVDAYDGTVDDVSFWRGLLDADAIAALNGGAVGLGLNASDMAAILDGFESGTSVQAAGLTWSPASGLTGVVGETRGTLVTTASIVLDESGNGMAGSPSDFLISSIERNATGTTLTWESTPGSTYIIQFSPNLVDWIVEVDDNVVADGSTTTFTDTDAGRLALPVGFYRLVR